MRLRQRNISTMRERESKGCQESLLDVPIVPAITTGLATCHARMREAQLKETTETVIGGEEYKEF